MGVAAGLTLREFWRLTPYSLQVVLAGYAKRIEHQYEIAAFAAANVMSMWSKRRVRPSQLLRSKRTVTNVSRFGSQAELEAYLERKRERLDD